MSLLFIYNYSMQTRASKDKVEEVTVGESHGYGPLISSISTSSPLSLLCVDASGSRVQATIHLVDLFPATWGTPDNFRESFCMGQPFTQSLETLRSPSGSYQAVPYSPAPDGDRRVSNAGVSSCPMQKDSRKLSEVPHVVGNTSTKLMVACTRVPDLSTHKRERGEVVDVEDILGP